jgi:hypothetical protein
VHQKVFDRLTDLGNHHNSIGAPDKSLNAFHKRFKVPFFPLFISPNPLLPFLSAVDPHVRLLCTYRIKPCNNLHTHSNVRAITCLLLTLLYVQ